MPTKRLTIPRFGYTARGALNDRIQEVCELVFGADPAALA
jgi:hypothetical protein